MSEHMSSYALHTSSSSLIHIASSIYEEVISDISPSDTSMIFLESSHICLACRFVSSILTSCMMDDYSCHREVLQRSPVWIGSIGEYFLFVRSVKVSDVILLDSLVDTRGFTSSCASGSGINYTC